MKCHNCAALLPASATACFGCGTQRSAAHRPGAGVPSFRGQLDAPGVARHPAMEAARNGRAELYAAAIGPSNTDRYLKIFEKFDRMARPSISFNWSALFLTLYWLLYRRMYLVAAGYMLAPAVLAVGSAAAGFEMPPMFSLTLQVLMALNADAIYYRHIQGLIRRTHRVSRDRQSHILKLALEGRTISKWQSFCVGTGIAVIYFVIAAVVILLSTPPEVPKPSQHPVKQASQQRADVTPSPT